MPGSLSQRRTAAWSSAKDSATSPRKPPASQPKVIGLGGNLFPPHLVLGPRGRTKVRCRSATGPGRCSLLVDESQERWDDLRGPDAILARLRTVEARLERLRLEVAEVG